VLTHREVSTVIPGAKNEAQIADNVATGEVRLRSRVMERLAAMRVG
jgi:aryl-alcohol dehydrogenase-like predicted oxidoreductase